MENDDEEENLHEDDDVKKLQRSLKASLKKKVKKRIVPDDDALRNPDLKIGGDIYAMTFASLVDPDMVNPPNEKGERKKGLLQYIEMSMGDMKKLYQGAAMVMCV